MSSKRIVAWVTKRDKAAQMTAIKKYVADNMPERHVEDILWSLSVSKKPFYKTLMKRPRNLLREPISMLWRDMADITGSVSVALRVLLAQTEVDVELIFVNQPELNLRADTPYRQQVIAMFKCLVEGESAGLSTSIKAALGKARAKGKKLGAPRKIVGETKEELIREGWSGSIKPKRVGEFFGVSRSTVVRTLDEAEADGWIDPSLR